MATHSSILAWAIPWTEKPGALQFMGSQKSQTELSTHAQLWTGDLNSLYLDLLINKNGDINKQCEDVLHACMLSHFSHV